MSQSHNDLSLGSAIPVSVALRTREVGQGGGWVCGLNQLAYHLLMLTVDVSQWLIDTQSFKLFSLTQNLIRMEKHWMKKLQLSSYSRTSPNDAPSEQDPTRHSLRKASSKPCFCRQLISVQLIPSAVVLSSSIRSKKKPYLSRLHQAPPPLNAPNYLITNQPHLSRNHQHTHKHALSTHSLSGLPRGSQMLTLLYSPRVYYLLPRKLLRRIRSSRTFSVTHLFSRLLDPNTYPSVLCVCEFQVR
ncbi:uncharacterized protein LOC131542279 isoform X3 [Onychostoma macrolepis]|uniref:uncharacterized protein LOC131542279 isoform X3 n=1 Tax=Onychostoma macrolepis TaxID=369639 RepID=UPI00272D4067|nr:uncharacterized protein LOC131542279 isoform X3 [Onychostoma macrolepis]